ncbi:MAG: selenoprotein B glycine/betaine/sarcosine/D-proline reductase [Deltaproteobacteria bacterium]|nr:selenoprotein B glycine/betaine/sarcosine/D-proline reductase [Deltaproteobacteria bacterium]
MARLEKMAEPQRSHIADTKLPTFDTHPWVDGPALSMRRIAIVSTAGLHRRNDMPFTFDPGDNYRIIPGDTAANELIMSHVSTNFDRSGFQQDWNIVFPLDRLHKLCDEGHIGSVARFHYSFMGAMDPKDLEQSARKLAGLLKEDNVDGVLLVPV